MGIEKNKPTYTEMQVYNLLAAFVLICITCSDIILYIVLRHQLAGFVFLPGAFAILVSIFSLSIVMSKQSDPDIRNKREQLFFLAIMGLVIETLFAGSRVFYNTFHRIRWVILAIQLFIDLSAIVVYAIIIYLNTDRNISADVPEEKRTNVYANIPCKDFVNPVTTNDTEDEIRFSARR